jgi:hypothetical protein
MRSYVGSSTPREKNGGNSLARAPAIMPGKGGRAPGKILDRLRSGAKKLTIEAKNFQNPNTAAYASSAWKSPSKKAGSQELPRPAMESPWFESLGRDRYQVYGGAFTV